MAEPQGPCALHIDALLAAIAAREAADAAAMRDIFEKAKKVLECQQAHNLIIQGEPIFVAREKAVRQIARCQTRSQGIQSTIEVAARTLTQEWGI